jgi:tryptophanyl-tRNA synthetase
MTDKEKNIRVMSGARPTGRQHLGNYLGAIKNYVALQDIGQCYYSIVDMHALTTLETTLNLKQNTYEMALDWLAAGIRPDESVLYVQSHIPQIPELHLYLSMVTPMGKLTDLPTFKDKVRNQPDNVNYGLLGYPVLMSADILMPRANYVPVGVDQAPHLEFTRELVRSFNYRYQTDVLIEPEIKVTEVPKVLGIDGEQKMSKSLNNEIELAATPEETDARVMQMVTDPQRQRRSDPGDPDICNVFSMHKIFSSRDEVERVNVECRRAGIGCVECKRMFAKNLNENLAPFRARRAEFNQDPDAIWDILHEGGKKMRAVAQETIADVRDAIGLPA